MALKPWCYWSIGIMGDGVSTSVMLDMTTDPFVLGAASSAGGETQLAFTFSITSSHAPTGITVVSSSDGQIVTPTLGAGGLVTFTWPIAIPLDSAVTMYGVLEF